MLSPTEVMTHLYALIQLTLQKNEVFQYGFLQKM